MVAHQRFLGAAAQRLLHGERVVQQVVRLDAGVDGGRVVPHHGGHDNPDAARLDLGRGIGVRLDDDDDRRLAALPRVIAEPADAAGHEQADITLPVDVGGAGRLVDPCCELPVRERDLQPDGAGGGAQPVEMPIEQERAAVVRAQRFVHALPEQKAVVEYRHHRRLGVADASVHIHRYVSHLLNAC